MYYLLVHKPFKMAAKNKTRETGVEVGDFVNSYVENEQKRKDSFELIQLMEKWSGCSARMWGPTISGFGSYHYKYASGHEGDAPMIGFSPRKDAFSLYVFSNTDRSRMLLAGLGKFKMGKACIYVRKLADIDISTLEKLCKENIEYLNIHHECACHDKSAYLKPRN